MVTIRLARHGAKKAPFYRIVATDSRNRRDGRFLEVVGHYDPRLTDGGLDFKADRIKYWLEKGAQPSQTVVRLMRTSGVLHADSAEA